MTLVLSLLTIVSLFILQGVCRRQKLTPPPLRMPLIAAVGIPLLTAVGDMVGHNDLPLLQQSLTTAITLLWTFSLIRLSSWTLLQLPAELGWWKPTAKILRDLITLAVITAVTMVVIQRDFRVNLVGLAATSAVVTAVVGLAAQETLKNLFAGISLQVDSPFEEGDWIDLGFTKGVVTSLRLMTTRVRSLDGSLTVVPNSRIAVEGLRRFKPDEPVGQLIDIGLDYSLPPRQAIQLLQSTLQNNRKVLQQPHPKVWVSSFADSSIIYRLLTWQKAAPEMPQLRSDVLEQVWYALHRIDQSIPYPIVREFRDQPIAARLPSREVNARQKRLLLASVEIFSTLQPEQLAILADNANCQSFGPGETIVRQGDQGNSLYMVVSGTLDVFKADQTTQGSAMPGQQVTSLQSSDFFGEMALCTGEARTASVICRDECVLIEIKRQHLVPLLETYPEILENMGSVIVSRRGELEALRENRDGSRRSALISRMQKLFGLSAPNA